MSSSSSPVKARCVKCKCVPVEKSGDRCPGCTPPAWGKKKCIKNCAYKAGSAFHSLGCPNFLFEHSLASSSSSSSKSSKQQQSIELEKKFKDLLIDCGFSICQHCKRPYNAPIEINEVQDFGRKLFCDSCLIRRR